MIPGDLTHSPGSRVGRVLRAFKSLGWPPDGSRGGLEARPGPADLEGCARPSPLTRQHPFQDAPSEDILGELGLVVVLVCDNDGDVHGLFHRGPVLRHGVPEELWAHGAAVSWHCPPHQALGPCYCWTLKVTCLILGDLLPVQGLIQQQPACFLLYGEDTLRGAVCPRPRDAVENLGASVFIRFELEAKDNSSSQSDKYLTTAARKPRWGGVERHCLILAPVREASSLCRPRAQQQETSYSGLRKTDPAATSDSQGEGTAIPGSASGGRGPCHSQGQILAGPPILSCVFARYVWMGSSSVLCFPARREDSLIQMCKQLELTPHPLTHGSSGQRERPRRVYYTWENLEII